LDDGWAEDSDDQRERPALGEDFGGEPGEVAEEAQCEEVLGDGDGGAGGADAGGGEEVEGDHEGGDEEESAAGGGEFPAVFGVEAGGEDGGGDGGEEEKAEPGLGGDGIPEGEDEGDGAADDEEAADELAPADVALLHEVLEDFGEGFARGRGRRGRALGDFGARGGGGE
jgi:hypothetical protein